MTKALDNNYYDNNYAEQLSREELLFFKNELEKKKEKIEQSLYTTSKELNAHVTSDPKR